MIKDIIKNLKPSSTLLINEESKRLEKEGKKIFKFGFGQSPFQIPENIVNELKNNSHQNKYLPMQGLPELREAIASYTSKKKNNNELFLLDDVKKEIKKTKIFNSFLIKNKINNVLIVSDKETEKNIVKSVRNLPNVKLINDAGTNVYDLIKYKNVLFTISSIKNIQQRLTNEKN